MKFLIFFIFLLNNLLIIICFKKIKSFKYLINYSKTNKNRLYAEKNNLKLLKYVREITNASIQVCNNALKVNNNDVKKAIEYIRINAKNVVISNNIKSNKDGLIGTKILNDKIVILKVSSDSDFVSNNKIFINFVKNLLNIILNTDINDIDNINNILEIPYVNEKNEMVGSVKDELNNLRNIFRENIQILRCKKYIKQNENEFLHYYIHNIIEENVGSSGALLILNIDNLNENINLKKEITDFANNLCMHIISAKPVSISIDKLNENIKKKEIEMIKESLKDVKKPQKILDNMINGKMKKFYNTTVLLEQEYMLNESKKKVSEILKDFSKQYAMNVQIKCFDYMIISEENILRE